jgi:putative salt-induced outer membrane protein
MRFATILPILVIAALPALADTVTLSNGDRVTGKVVNTAGGKLTVKTEFMGDVQIDRKGVVSIQTDEPLNVTTAAGETIVGTIDTEAEKLRVTKPDESEVSLAIGEFEAIRDDAAQAAYDREQERQNNPGLRDFWKGTVDFGWAGAAGNARTTTLSTGAEAIRQTGFDKITLTFAQIYSSQSTTEPTGSTANRISGKAGYNRDVSGKLFVYGGAAFDFDEFQNLDLRSVLGGGLGYHIIRSKPNNWDFGAGGNWNREAFSTGLTRNSFEVNLMENSDHQLNDRVKLYQSFAFFPNISNSGEYRFNFDGGVDFKLNSMFSLTANVSDRYLSNPIGGNKKNDVIYTMGVKLSFEQK